jgi:hypothetical protein
LWVQSAKSVCNGTRNTTFRSAFSLFSSSSPPP